ncbi:MAG TPA: ROK family transcriptional regulator [Gaiellaceae bacterium]|jgi:predicted NBD/HSP70 family sugar kinase|nr:ROK family transcriptional regulator [Gaiellaceae bacterium]
MSSYRTGSVALTRDLNRVAVLRLIASGGPIARTHIARRLGLSPATVTSVTRELLDQGLLRVAEQAPSSGGRPAVLLEIVGSAATAFGVKVAPDHLVGVRVNLDSDVLERYEEPLDSAAPDAPERIADALARWLGGDGDSEFPPLLGVGLGVPGISHELGKSVDSPMLGWRDLPLARQLEERIGVPVLVDNDVNTLAIAERLYGRGRNVDHFLTVTLGRGIGLGIVAGGDIYHGYAGGAGEFGHTTVLDDGPRCSCGKRGCLETVAADPALVARARREGVVTPRAGIERLRRVADEGSVEARAIFADAAAVLGRSVANLVNVLAPELVLVSGEGTQAWRHMAAAFDTALRTHLFGPLAGVVVEVDPWDDAKWAVGAASLVLRSTFTPALEPVSADTSIRARLPRVPEALV